MSLNFRLCWKFNNDLNVSIAYASSLSRQKKNSKLVRTFLMMEKKTAIYSILFYVMNKEKLNTKLLEAGVQNNCYGTMAPFSNTFYTKKKLKSTHKNRFVQIKTLWITKNCIICPVTIYAYPTKIKIKILFLFIYLLLLFVFLLSGYAVKLEPLSNICNVAFRYQLSIIINKIWYVVRKSFQLVQYVLYIICYYLYARRHVPNTEWVNEMSHIERKKLLLCHFR